MRFYLMLLSLLIAGCGLLDAGDIDVQYKVTGTAGAVDITIENEDGGTSQFDDVALPWQYDFKVQPGAFVYVSAQNQMQSGEITVMIYRDGELFKRSTSAGAYVIATASGIIE
jgi:hypothetical protein